MAGTMPRPDMEMHPNCMKLIDQCRNELWCFHTDSEFIDLVPGAYSPDVTNVKHLIDY